MTNTASTRHRGHPITVAAAEMHETLDELVEVSTWSMDREQARATLRELTRAEARVAELKLRVAAHGEKNKVGDDTGATSTANWWAHATKATRAAAHRDVKLAKALDAELHEPVRRALAAGDLLLDQAADHDAKALRVLGRRILEVVDPAAADAHEAKLLEQEEHAAEAAAMFRMHDDGHGKCHGKFTISSRHAAMLKKALLAKAAPKHQAAVNGQAPEPGQPTAHKMGLAFQEYLETYPAEALPKAGGVNATVVVTMTLEALLGGLQAAQFDTGERISAAEARRMACAAGVIPAVLDGKSKVLDLGRKRRFHTESQRIVATIEQGGCTAEGCDWPPGMCHMHHPTPWSQGGETNRDGRLLCPRHHTLAHDVRYEMTTQPTGKVRFHRRT